MKKILALAFVAMGFVACETIDEGERYENERPFKLQRNVLVEDFTGQNCVNCPAASTLLHNLIETTRGSNGEHIVAVSIHGGAMSIDATKSPFGLALPFCEEYNEHWGVQAWPSGMINRTAGKDNRGEWIYEKPCTTDKWITSIAQHGFSTATIDLAPTISFDKDTRTANISVTATEGVTSDMRLTVWLTESKIEGRQKFTDHEEEKYVHNHVLRDCLTDPYGDALTNGQWSMTYQIPKGYGMGERIASLNAKPENMAVVAFITDKNGEVLQVIDMPLEK